MGDTNALLREAEAAAAAPDAWAGRLPPLIELGAALDADDGCRLRALVETAAEREVAALRVPPAALAGVRAAPRGAALRLVTVLDPEGTEEPLALARQVGEAVQAGADEVDLGLPLADLLEGDTGVVHERIQAAREVSGDAGIGLVLATQRLPSPVDLTAAARGAVMGGATHLITDPGTEPTDLAALATVLAVLEEAGGRIGLKVPAGSDLERTGAALLVLVEHFLGPAFATPARLRLVLET